MVGHCTLTSAGSDCKIKTVLSGGFIDIAAEHVETRRFVRHVGLLFVDGHHTTQLVDFFTEIALVVMGAHDGFVQLL